ncbi:MAG: arylsulfotransferase family protein [Planctomycetota bacterium]
MRGLEAFALLLLLGSCEPEPPRPHEPVLADLAALGYTGWDESAAEPRASDGEPDPRPFLYCDDVSRVLLVANDGEVLCAWTIAGFDQVEFAELLPDGDVVALSVDQGVARVRPDGSVVWRWEGNAHHELAPRRDGGFVVPVWRVARYRGRRVRFDELVWLSADGVEERRWSTLDQREMLTPHHRPLPLDTEPEPRAGEPDETTYDRFHVNALVELHEDQLGLGEPAGALLVSARNANLVFVLDAERNRILWSWGPGQLDFQHTPTPTPRGVLIFDNGYHRGRSRLVEVEPATNRILWEWTAPDFFTKTRGSCQRLASGQTFVCESERGRLFELDARGRVVWSWVNPVEDDGKRRRIYRARRVSAR